ncbi:MAG TPA: sodium:proton antiporter, partial [Candidatus Dormibacteraeota bacterium]|nr:sodium:proton antiporter [Candidatus Dormibacteraeota bacterium]
MEHPVLPSLWMATPFVALLAAIALAPLFFANWWSKHFTKVSFGLAAITLVYYIGVLHAQERAARTGLEYLSFICLIGSLYVVSGGIHINVRGEATPGVNVLFLLVGALISNVLGTTGASMLMIRPWLRMNKYRLTAHHVIFFIFIVSNVGGSLTPIGDPPLFLGYLKGVPFWWVGAQCWPIWLTGIGILLVMFCFVDVENFRRAPRAIREKETAHEEWRFQGLSNLFFLAVILGAALINRPAGLRELLMVAAAAGSYFTTSQAVHHSNDFNFHPIKEVAILFAGIFATMMPALDWLQGNASHLGNLTPAVFFWGSGTLSSVLDNAPTYLTFLSAGQGAISPDTATAIAAYIKTHGSDLASASGSAHADIICQAISALGKYFPAALASGNVTPDQAQVALMLDTPAQIKCLKAISIGSVFFGANTYIGNGPNFMVKAIADQQKAHTPSFLVYV